MTTTAAFAAVAIECVEQDPDYIDYVDGDMLDALLQYVPGGPVVEGASFAAIYQHGEPRSSDWQAEVMAGGTPIYLHRFVTDDIEGHGRYNLDVFVAPSLARIPDEDEWHLLAVQEVAR